MYGVERIVVTVAPAEHDARHRATAHDGIVEAAELRRAAAGRRDLRCHAEADGIRHSVAVERLVLHAAVVGDESNQRIRRRQLEMRGPAGADDPDVAVRVPDHDACRRVPTFRDVDDADVGADAVDGGRIVGGILRCGSQRRDVGSRVRATHHEAPDDFQIVIDRRQHRRLVRRPGGPVLRTGSTLPHDAHGQHYGHEPHAFALMTRDLLETLWLIRRRARSTRSWRRNTIPSESRFSALPRQVRIDSLATCTCGAPLCAALEYGKPGVLRRAADATAATSPSRTHM